jgi:nucleotide-binding universal stress UspA family protein
MTVVLAAIDHTPAARPVLATTVAVARVLKAVPRAIHARGQGPAEGPADGATAAEEEARSYGIPLIVVDTAPVTAIVEAAENPEVALVALALHGQPSRHAAGDTALAVVTQLSKPLLVVHPEQPVRADPKRVLFPLDGTRGVSSAVRSMISWVIGAGVEVIAIHVFDPRTVPRFLDAAEDLDMWSDEFLARHCAELGVRLEVRTGDPARATLDLAAEEDVDVIALGWRQDLTPEHARVVRTMLVEARRPVALIPFPDVRQRSDHER